MYKIRLDQLYYNDQNDRIATWMCQYKTQHQITSMDTTNKDSYNQTIHGFITASNPSALRNTQKNIALIGQSQPGVVLSDGRIIDGNRRYTCLRNLEKDTGKTQYFEAVILEHSLGTSEKQIKMLELLLQHGVDKPVDYDPIDRLVGIYHDIEERALLTEAEYADSVDLKPIEIKKEVEHAKLMVEFLEFINMDKQYHVAKSLNLYAPLQELHTMLQKCHGETAQELKQVVFTNCAAQPLGDMTRYIRKIKKIAGNPQLLRSYLEEQSEMAEAVCDKLAAYDHVTEEILGQEIIGDSNLQTALSHSTEKYVTQADSIASRNHPALLADKAFDALDTMDTQVLKKLDANQQDTVRQKLENIQALILSIQEVLDDQ